ncbi:MAG: tetratricopeptide repeat protein [Gammaproteobacteria bacterium]|nr:tetratricopeptide repeat protein [Gammaproteobacteria bacterium]
MSRSSFSRIPARCRVLAAVAGLALPAVTWTAADSRPFATGLVPFRDQIEEGYNARDIRAIEATVAALKKAARASGQEDTGAYYAAFARLRQSAIPGIPKSRARDYLEQCIHELAPLIERRGDYAQARALHASCLGASASHYVLRAATRGMAADREMSAALKLAPDDPWIVFQDAVSDFLTPAMFGGSKERALARLRRADQLFVASRPAGSTRPVFGEGETWLYIGRVQLALGRRGEARKALERARELAPGSADIRDEIAKL